MAALAAEETALLRLLVALAAEDARSLVLSRKVLNIPPPPFFSGLGVREPPRGCSLEDGCKALVEVDVEAVEVAPACSLFDLGAFLSELALRGFPGLVSLAGLAGCGGGFGLGRSA